MNGCASDERQSQSCCSTCACAVCTTRRHKGCFGMKFRIVHNAELAKLLGLRPRPQWGSLQRSPIPLAGAGGGDAPSRTHPLSYPLPLAPPLTLNPASAPVHLLAQVGLALPVHAAVQNTCTPIRVILSQDVHAHSLIDSLYRTCALHHLIYTAAHSVGYASIFCWEHISVDV